MLNTNETCYSVQVAKIYNLNKAETISACSDRQSRRDDAQYQTWPKPREAPCALRPPRVSAISAPVSSLAWRWRYRAVNTYGSDARKDELKASAPGHGRAWARVPTAEPARRPPGRGRAGLPRVRASDAFASPVIIQRVSR